MEQEQELLKVVQAHMAELGEHFDSVQIFCTKKTEEETLSVFDGCGSWFARYGQVKCWIVTEENDMVRVNKEQD